MSETESNLSSKLQTPSNQANYRVSSSGSGSGSDEVTADSTAAMVTAGSSQSVQMDTGQGKTIIADGVVAKIAGMAAREIEGVHDLVAIGSSISGFANRLSRSDKRINGVNVEVGRREAAVDLNVTVDYGVSIPQVAAAVRQNIIERVWAMTGLIVKEVNINAADLYFPAGDSTSQSRVQ